MAFKPKFSYLSKLHEQDTSGGRQTANQNQEQGPSLHDVVDEQLLPVFLEEADDLLPKIRVGLYALHEQPDDKLRQRTLSRLLHTVKGSARMAGAMRIGDLAHRMEDRVHSATPRQYQANYLDILTNDLSQIYKLVEELRGGKVPTVISDSSNSMLLSASRSRTVPFSSIRERLYRIVRQTGKELNRRANLELFGSNIELDRGVLDKMTAPFEHLLRNAMAHGLETPEQRERLGKPTIGEIQLSLRRENKEIVFELSDDGAGLDVAQLQQKAWESGLLREGETISAQQAIQLIFTPGLSTAKEVTEIAGRGVGLDVVQNEVNALGGHINVISSSGKGVCFTIHLPLK